MYIIGHKLMFHRLGTHSIGYNISYYRTAPLNNCIVILWIKTMSSCKIFTQKVSGAGLRCVFVMTLRTLLNKQLICRWFEAPRGSYDGNVIWSFVHSTFNSHQLPCQLLKLLIVNQIQLNGFNFRHSKEQLMLIGPNSKTFSGPNYRSVPWCRITLDIHAVIRLNEKLFSCINGSFK